MSYGTVMIGKLADGKTVADWMRSVADWQRERQVEGFVDEYTLAGDDGTTIVSCVIFTSKELYQKLADDPVQDEWWQTKARPLLAADPQWIDGDWPPTPA